MSLNPVSKIGFFPDDEIPYGKRKGQRADTYSIGYEQAWGYETRLIGIVVDANDGEVLYSISPHGFIEEWEE